MLEYLKQVVSQALAPDFRSYGTLRQQIQQILVELGRLDTRDFEPSVQAQLVTIRGYLVGCVEFDRFSEHAAQEQLRKVLPILDNYRGSGSYRSSRSFNYLVDPALQRIITRDYDELTLKLFPSGAWKSTVIMAGSILEAILHDVLAEPKRAGAANVSAHAMKIKPKKGTIEHGAWDLVDLIEVAADTAVGVLSKERADTIDQVLRHYRNFVHPKREIRAKHECNEAEAGLAKYGLDGVCDHLERTL